MRYRVSVGKAGVGGIIVIALAAAVFWGGLAWALWSGNMALVGIYVRILGTMLGVVIPVSIILALIASLRRWLVRSR